LSCGLHNNGMAKAGKNAVLGSQPTAFWPTVRAAVSEQDRMDLVRWIWFRSGHSTATQIQI